MPPPRRPALETMPHPAAEATGALDECPTEISSQHRSESFHFTYRQNRGQLDARCRKDGTQSSLSGGAPTDRA